MSVMPKITSYPPPYFRFHFAHLSLRYSLKLVKQYKSFSVFFNEKIFAITALLVKLTKKPDEVEETGPI